MDAHYLSSSSATGRHVKAAEALQLGVVDQVTERSCVDAAVKLALSVAGKTQKRKEKKKHIRAQGTLWYKTHSLFTAVKKLKGKKKKPSLSRKKRNPSSSSYFRQVRPQEVSTCRLWKSKEAENTAGRSSTTEVINVSWLCQMCSDVFTAFAVLFRRAKRDKLS